MQSTTHKTEILETFSSLRNLSYQEKKAGFLSEEKVNSFLDAILEFKKNLKEKTLEINHINEKIEKLTWFNNLDEESLMLLNDLISSAKDLKSSLIRQYISMNPLRKKELPQTKYENLKLLLMNYKNHTKI